MRFLAGWIAGLATVWAALAIWKRVPPMPYIDAEFEAWAEDVPKAWPPPPEHDPEAFDRVWHPGRPGYRDSIAGE
uniref:Minor tail protein n=2 Tax=unclassified bacterial viruses TaxID=12333 RepID=A0AAU7J8E9_9VIRU